MESMYLFLADERVRQLRSDAGRVRAARHRRHGLLKRTIRPRR
jgi:hypothetical protein